MNMVTRTLELDSETDARLSKMAAERQQDVSAVVAEAITLLDATIDFELPDVQEDRRRYNEYLKTGLAVPWEEVKAWMDSWGTGHELPRPQARKLG